MGLERAKISVMGKLKSFWENNNGFSAIFIFGYKWLKVIFRLHRFVIPAGKLLRHEGRYDSTHDVAVSLRE